MKASTNCGGLVDKKEIMLFEALKDKSISSSKWFKRDIKRDYGFEPSTDLYVAITNYQIKKYGSKLVTGRLIPKLRKEELRKRADYMRTLKVKRKQGRKSDEV
jgi:hypothetical protein